MRDNAVKRFFDNFGTMPDEKPPLIPQRWRIPFFLGMSLIALVLLVLLVQFVVIPGIRSQQAATPATPTPETTVK